MRALLLGGGWVVLSFVLGATWALAHRGMADDPIPVEVEGERRAA